MPSLSPYRDGPHQLKYEAQQISLNFIKNSDGTAVLKWNIPVPVFGCNPESLAYDGIVIVVSDAPLKQEQKPVAGTAYTNDPTASAELHAGDAINGALVVVALYGDKTTNQYTIDNIEPLTPYYFAAYAVSKQLTYDNDGAHAYSLPVNREKESGDYPGYQELRVLGQPNKKANIRSVTNKGSGTMLGQTSTSLDPLKDYTITVHSDILGQVDITVNDDITTWDTLIESINREIALIGNPLMSPIPPNIGSLYLDEKQQRLFEWNGHTYDELDLLVSEEDATLVTSGAYWFNVETNQLDTFDGDNWLPVEYTTRSKFPNSIAAGDVWINPQEDFAAKFNGTTWCKNKLFSSITDPSLPVTPLGGTMWYDENTGFIKQWDTQGNCWKQIKAIYHSQDPSSLPDGTLWFDYNEQKLYSLNDNQDWTEVNARINKLPAKVPTDGDLWFNVKTEQLMRYDFAAKQWDSVEFIYWPLDPRDRKGCDKWWDSASDVMFVWDFLTLNWVRVNAFIQSSRDPSIEPLIEQGSIWDSPAAMDANEWDGMQWISIEATKLETDPHVIPAGTHVKINTDFFVFDGTDWEKLSVQTSKINSEIENGVYWFKPSDRELKVKQPAAWVNAPFVARPQVPTTGSQYYNTATDTLMEWKNGDYVEAVLPVTLYVNEYNNVMVVSKTLGSESHAALVFDQAFKDDIKPHLFSFEPQGGIDAISKEPTYKTIGSGTDGSVDERREYANYVLSQLGYPLVQVELSKAQVDEAIDDALEVLRMRTSAVYSRRYMAMDLLPEQQVYEFSNKKQGLDKVTRVNKVMRTRHGRIGAHSYNDTFGSSMIQQLYYAGSFDLLSYHLLASYNEMVNHMFANDVTFSWNEYNRILQIHQVTRNRERVLLEVELEKTEQEILVDRNLRNWIKRYVLGSCMITLGNIRGKFSSVGGAGGGASMNGADLIQRGDVMIEKCIDDIQNMVISGLDQYGSSSLVIMG